MYDGPIPNDREEGLQCAFEESGCEATDRDSCDVAKGDECMILRSTRVAQSTFMLTNGCSSVSLQRALLTDALTPQAG